MGGDPVRACDVGGPRPVIAESFVDLNPAVRPLGDHVEMSIWPYTKKMHVLNRTRNGSYTRTRANGKKKEDGVGKKTPPQ